MKREAAPAVPPRPKVRRAFASVGAQRDQNLGHLHSQQGRLDHHLEGELHPPGAQVHALKGVAAEAAQPAVEVAHAGAEKEPAQGGDGGVADPAVLPGHGARQDASEKSIAHDQVVARPQPLQERVEAAEVVALVGIAHDNVAAAGLATAPRQIRLRTPAQEP